MSSFPVVQPITPPALYPETVINPPFTSELLILILPSALPTKPPAFPPLVELIFIAVGIVVVAPACSVVFIAIFCKLISEDALPIALPTLPDETVKLLSTIVRFFIVKVPPERFTVPIIPELPSLPLVETTFLIS